MRSKSWLSKSILDSYLLHNTEEYSKIMNDIVLYGYCNYVIGSDLKLKHIPFDERIRGMEVDTVITDGIEPKDS